MSRKRHRDSSCVQSTASATPLGQGHLNPQLAAIAENNLGRNLDHGERGKYSGLCVGYAAIYSCFATTGQETIWRTILTLLSINYNSPTFLASLIQLSPSHSPETVQNILRIAHDEIVINYGSCWHSGISEIQYEKFLTPDGLFEFQGKKIKHFANAVGYFTPDNLLSLLQEDLYCHQGVFLVMGEYLPNTGRAWLRHTCAIRHDRTTTRCWYFYDPDTGLDLEFESTSKLIVHINAVLGHSLALRAASWDDAIQPALVRFLKSHDQLKNDTSRLNELGLHLIVQYSAPVFDELIRTAYTCENIARQIAVALNIRDSEGNSGFECMILFSPKSLADLLIISKTNLEMYYAVQQAMIDYAAKQGVSLLWKRIISLAQTETKMLELLIEQTTTSNTDNLRGIHSIIMNSSREIIQALYNLARQNKRYCDVFFSVLITKNELGVTFFEYIIRVMLSKFLCKLFALAATDVNLMRMLATAIMAQSDGNKNTGLHTLAARKPRILPILFDHAKTFPSLHQAIQTALQTVNAAGRTGQQQVAESRVILPCSFCIPHQHDSGSSRLFMAPSSANAPLINDRITGTSTRACRQLTI